MYISDEFLERVVCIQYVYLNKYMKKLTKLTDNRWHSSKFGVVLVIFPLLQCIYIYVCVIYTM